MTRSFVISGTARDARRCSNPFRDFRRREIGERSNDERGRISAAERDEGYLALSTLDWSCSLRR